MYDGLQSIWSTIPDDNSILVNKPDNKIQPTNPSIKAWLEKKGKL